MNYTFEYPLVFLLIPFYFICIRYCKAKLKSIYFPNSQLLAEVSSKRWGFLNIFKLLAFLLLVVALASPVKRDDIIFNKNKGYEISLILDASYSMKKYNKFGVVKDIVLDFIKKRENDKLALTIFAEYAYIAIPLTYDKKALTSMLDRIDVGVIDSKKTALYEALFLNSRVFKDSKAKEKIAILLTDGVNNVDSIPLRVAIDSAKKSNIKVYTVGIGDYDPKVLQQIAKETGGKFFSANSKDELKKIYDEINRLEKSEFKTEKYVKKSYYYHYFLALALLFLTLYITLYRK
jgi:Ca-activated chloride channel family protein